MWVLWPNALREYGELAFRVLFKAGLTDFSSSNVNMLKAEKLVPNSSKDIACEAPAAAMCLASVALTLSGSACWAISDPLTVSAI